MSAKIGILSLALMVGTTSLFADDNEKGIDLYNAGMYREAKDALIESLKSGESDKAEVCYYLGELYAQQNMKDSAAYYYKEGLVANPEYVFNAIGELKLNLANNPNADKAFSGFITGKNKKNPAIYAAIARAYLPVSDTKAKEYLELAKGIGPKAPEVFILEGDMHAARKKIGDAANSYEQAIYFDPDSKEAYFKYAKIYTRSNPQYAIDMLNKLIAIDPEYKVAYAELANVYYQNAKFAEAADAYSKYISTETSDIDDLARYAAILYFSGNLQKAQEIVSKVSVRAPESAVMKRIDMYIAYEKGDFAKSLELAENLMKTVDSSRLINRDYIYYARNLAKNKLTDRAIPAYVKAIAVDTASLELLRELEQEYETAGDYPKAIEVYERFMANENSEIVLSDYFNLGKAYYMAAVALRPTEEGGCMAEADSVQMTTYLKEAVGMFTKVKEKLPDNYLGYFWSARANSVMDPESTAGLAKPDYEAAVVILENDAKNPKLLIECYRYLGYYHYIKEELETSAGYWQKILALDPENVDAKHVLEVLKK